MATTGVIKGKDLMFYVGTTAVGHSTSCDLNISTNMIDITSKDSNGWKEILPDIKEWGISCDALTAWDAAYGINDILEAQLAGTKLIVKFTTDIAGDIVLSGDIYIDANNIQAPNGDKSSFSFSGQGTGQLAKAVVS